MFRKVVRTLQVDNWCEGIYNELETLTTPQNSIKRALKESKGWFSLVKYKDGECVGNLFVKGDDGCSRLIRRVIFIKEKPGRFR